MKYIKVRTQFKGFHKYENAPNEVSFLKNLHRHLFKVSLQIEVNHNDRDIEFFILQRELEDFLADKEHQIKDGIGSCETIGEDILRHFTHYYPNREIEMEVSEDGENSAVVNNKLK